MAVVSCAWSKISTSGVIPNTRTGHSVSVLGENAFVFGGSCVQNGEQAQPKYYNEMYKVSIEDQQFTWALSKVEGIIPIARDTHATCFWGIDLYLFGGKQQLISEKCIAGVYKYATDALKWTEINVTGPAPQSVGYSVSRCGTKMFAFGGILDGDATNDMFVLDLNSNNWIPIRCGGFPPHPRCDHGCEVVNGRVYVFGGTGQEDEYYNDLHCFDTFNLNWTQPLTKGLSPSPRSGHSFVAHHDKDIYVLGGSRENNVQTGNNEVFKLRLETNKWKQQVIAGLSAPPGNLHGHGVFILHSNMYVFGGIGPTGYVDMNHVYVLRLINPSERKPVMEHFLQDFCNDKNSPTCWQQTKKPNVCYKLSDSDSFQDSGIFKDVKLPLSDQVIKSEHTDAETWAIQGILNKAAQIELASARQNFENERENVVRYVARAKSETDQLIIRHQVQNETWWKERLKENDAERIKLRKAWKDLETEKKSLESERKSLEKKARSVAHLLQQII